MHPLIFPLYLKAQCVHVIFVKSVALLHVSLRHRLVLLRFSFIGAGVLILQTSAFSL